MRKLFTLLTVALFATSLWSENATFTMSEIFNGSNTSKTVTSPADATVSTTTSASNADDGKLSNDGNYFQIVLTSRTFNAASLNGYINSDNTSKNWGFQFSTDGGTSWGKEVTQANDGDKSGAHNIAVSVSIPTGANGIRIIRRAGTSTYVMSVTLTLDPDCDAPAQALVLSSNAAEAVYAGDVITFSTTGGNGGAKTLAGANSETITDSVWTATAGTHTFTASQERNGDYCEQESELVLNVAAASPVSAVSVAGETSAYVGSVLTYTATAANATAYEWYLDDVKQGSDSAKFIYTAVKGSHSIVCKARNKFNVDPQWISSDAKALTVTNPSGILISFTVNSNANGASGLSGIFAGNATAKVSLTKGSSETLGDYTGYKMDRGKYAGVTLTSGTFVEGDTVSFMVTKASGTAKLYLYNSETGANRLDSIPFSGQTGWATFILNQSTTGVYLYRSDPDVKPYDQNPYVAAVKVARPKGIASVDTALVNVKVNNVAISEANMTALLADKTLELADEYLEAPTVKFFKKTTITYEDDSKKYINDSAAITATVNGAGKWQAQYTIDEDTYTVTMAKIASYTVTYKFGETTLGSENVVANGHPAKYATYQTLNDGNLSTFNSWYSKSDLSGDAVTIAEAVITKDTTFFGKFDFIYAESINIEQWILDNAADSASSVALIALLGTRHYASNISYIKGTNELDSLSTKDDRNEPYLGLKVKQAGKLLNFRLAKDTYVKIKFGAIKNEKPQVSINGGAYIDVTLTDGVYSYTATEADLVSIKTVSGNAVVFKQIMINEPIAEVVLPALYTVTYNAGAGTCAKTSDFVQFADDKVTLPNATPADGYKFDGWFTAATEGTKVGKAGDKITLSKDTTLYAQYSEFGFYIAGIGGWDPDQVLVNGISHTFENLAAGSYEFKITKDGTWGTEKGFSDLTASEMIAGLYGNSSNNVCFTLTEPGDVTITYDGDLFKAEGNFEPQTIKIKGGWDEWAEHTAELSDDKKSASVTLALEIAENVEFGVLYNSDFRANGKTFVRDDNSASGITGNTGNMKLTSDKAGAYKFTWTFGTNGLEITFPSETAIDNVAEEGKAIKVIRNGQLFIEKNGKTYNVQGQVVK